MKQISERYQVVVVGGGMAGVCAAIASARTGAKTVLIQNRPVLGGNTSSEIKVGVLGADCHIRKKNARETGILEEVQLESKSKNPARSFHYFDLILWEKAQYQKNLTLYLNTHVISIKKNGSTLTAVRAVQLTSETEMEIVGDIFIDCTGDGTVAALAGAEYMSGWESVSEFKEPHAADTHTNNTAGSSIQFVAVDMGKPVPFVKPDWAYTYTEEDLKDRPHSNENPGRPWHGYWWFELGGEQYDTIDDAEEIRNELLRCMFGIWDHIKNGGDHGAETYALDWIGLLPGKRESRRIVGDYILTENDLVEARPFEDAVAYGGWPVDSHTPDSIRRTDKPPILIYNHLKEIYPIPYRCLYSCNIENLMMAGRLISCTHLAHSSSRVMGTASLTGQAAGTAAAIAVAHGVQPRAVGFGGLLRDLQQRLLDDDCFIPGIVNTLPNDVARSATVSASGSIPGHTPENVINGKIRNRGDEINCWAAPLLPDHGAWIRLDLQRETTLQEMVIRFDSNLNEEITLTMSHKVNDAQSIGAPPTLIADYDVAFLLKGHEVTKLQVRGNYQRMNRHALPDVLCDSVRVAFLRTHGDACARVFEIRLKETAHE